jgi:hypothetical protein
MRQASPESCGQAADVRRLKQVHVVARDREDLGTLRGPPAPAEVRVAEVGADDFGYQAGAEEG